ncbi:hypothetical protein Bra3105_17695 [Brachybacterium halotolerans subsp. kimchii]|uniref:hypothetical protein n=1 Tax=Brachybacterium halotolerans TaxID=2795215 RepID=UPI001E621EA3|nr:hypothetical protein [Brachybacterium halotolerans]UEJ82638.1 hypothetical protein Bra3105_17695 [Brachybacterium halotolerans subsp. kimchii]
MTRARLVTLQDGDTHWDFTPGGTTIDGHEYYFEDLPGWFGGVSVRSNPVDRYGHGQFESRAWRTERALTLKVSVIVPQPWDRDPLERRMSSILWHGGYGTLTVENDLKLSARVRLDGEIGVVETGDRELTFQIPLLASDPFLYGEPRTEFSYPAGTGIGLVYPWFSGFFDPPADTGVHQWEIGSTFMDLSDLMGTGVMGAGGGASLAIDTLWASDGLTSLRVNPGSTRSSAAYIVPQQTPIGEWAGRWVVVEADLHIETAIPDADSTNSAPVTSIIAGVNFTDGREPRYDYGSSGPGPTAPGTYHISTGFLMPDDLLVYSGWFLRLFNGSKTVPVWWDNLKVTGYEVPTAETARSTEFYIDGWRVCQGWDLDQVTGGYYVAQPKSTFAYPRRVNLATNPSFENGLLQQLNGADAPGNPWSGNASGGVDTAWAAYGTQSLKIGPKSSTSTNDTTFYPFGNQSDVIAAALGMTPGKTFTVGATIHLTKPQTGTLNGHARRIRINNRQSGVTDWEWALSEAAPNAAGDWRVKVTFTVPSNSVGIHMNLCNGSATDTVWWDALTVEEGVTDGSWFDAGAESSNPVTERVNLAKNPTFTTLRDQVRIESADPIAVGGGATGTLDTAWMLDGGSSLKISAGTNASGAAYIVGRGDLTDEWKGRLVTIGATIRTTAVATDLAGDADNVPRAIMVGQMDGTTVTNWHYAVSPQAPNTPGVYRLKVTTRLPESGGWFVRLFNGSQTQPVWWDAVTIEEGETDGSWFVAERGTLVARKNYATNPSFTSLARQFGEPGSFTSSGGASLDVATDWSATGTTSVKVTPTGSNTSRVNLNTGGNSVTAWAAGMTLTVSATIRLAEAQTGSLHDGARCIELWATRNGSTTMLARSTPAPNTAGAHRVSMTVTIPTEATAFNLSLCNGSTAQACWWDALLIENGPNLRPYFDGSTAMARWTGAANASASELASTYSDQDAYIRRLDPDGNELDQMLLTGGGHVNEVAVEHDPADPDHAWIWIQYDATPGFGVRMKYRPGIVYPGDTGIQGLGVTGKIVVDYSILRGEICVRTRNTDGSDGIEGTYEVFDLEAYKAGGLTVKRRLTDIPKVPHAYQGYAFDSSFLYVAHGGSKEDAIGIWRYAWDGSDKADPTIIRTSGGQGVGGGVTRHEMEGVAIREGATPAEDTLVFGINGGDLHERIMSVHDLQLPQFLYREEWANAGEPGEVVTPDGILTYGEELSDPEAVVTNGGNADAYLLAAVIGEFPGGVTISAGAGSTALTYPWEITREAPLQLDGQGSAFIGDTNVTHLLTARDFTVLQVASESTASVFLDGLQGGTGYLQVQISDTYI